MIELLCLDIDGTLLNSEKELLKENIEAVHYAIKKGVKVFIASGRSVTGIEELMDQLGIERNAICLNGGLIIYRNEVIYEARMPAYMVAEIIDLAETYKSQVFLSTAEFTITNSALSEELQKIIDKGSLKSQYHFCRDYGELRTEAVKIQDKIIKASIKEIEEENYEQLKQDLIELNLFNVAKSDTYFLDINPREGNKGQGVQAVAKFLNIPMKHVMCIGDNENDKEMIQAAGIGIAMGNAVEEVRLAADYITADNDSHGAADAIYKYLRDESGN